MKPLSFPKIDYNPSLDIPIAIFVLLEIVLLFFVFETAFGKLARLALNSLPQQPRQALKLFCLSLLNT